MIASLTGILQEKSNGKVILNVGGVGYELGVSRSTSESLPSTGNEVYLHCYLQVREDAMQLYGFFSSGGKAIVFIDDWPAKSRS